MCKKFIFYPVFDLTCEQTQKSNNFPLVFAFGELNIVLLSASCIECLVLDNLKVTLAIIIVNGKGHSYTKFFAYMKLEAHIGNIQL